MKTFFAVVAGGCLVMMGFAGCQDPEDPMMVWNAADAPRYGLVCEESDTILRIRNETTNEGYEAVDAIAFVIRPLGTAQEWDPVWLPADIVCDVHYLMIPLWLMSATGLVVWLDEGRRLR